LKAAATEPTSTEDVTLEGRVVVVTGASAGLGRAYAEALGRAGARVVLTARRSNQLAAVVAELEAGVGVVGDVADPRVADEVVEVALARFGRIDALVNNAGGVRDRTLLKMSDEEFDDVIRAHVHGTFYMSRACVRPMREAGGGTIINIGSDSGLRGAFGQSNYAAAKGAILGLTLTWARELKRYGITCNCVLPNALTAMTEHLPQLLSDYRYGPPEAFPRALGEAADVAPLIVLLASARWRVLNGTVLSLGGDKLSVWEPPVERYVAFMHGGWSVAELDRTLASALLLEHPEPLQTDPEPIKRSLDGATHS
jgi:NAD(P)-dependent dehydrogenase (short-subunit alcohol dehydrogenase family)